MKTPTVKDLLTIIDKVHRLHVSCVEMVPDTQNPEYDVPFYYCGECSPDGPDPDREYPCRTVRILEGEK